MPALCRVYPSVSPWNIRCLTLGDYLRLIEAIQQASQQEVMTPADRR